ncbi:MAG: tetratricopeptide repeat protein, partial [Planctomycetaceae bacterium]
MTEERRDAVVGWVTIAVVVTVLLIVGWMWSSDRDEVAQVEPPSANKVSEAKDYLQSANSAFDAGNYRAARKLAETAIQLDPLLFEAALLGGDAAIESKEFDKAIELFERVPDGDSRSAINAKYGSARVNYLRGIHDVAERTLRAILERRPGHISSDDLLSEILDVQGRRQASVKYAMEVAREGRSSLEALMLLTDPEFVISPNNRAQRATDRTPELGGPKLGLARAAFDEGDNDRGWSLVREAIATDPSLLEARLLWGKRLLDSDAKAFVEWHESLPKQAEDFSELWFLRGEWAQRHDQPRAAIRCFWQTLVLEPNHRAAHFKLAQLLRDSKPTAAKEVLDRGLQLSRLKKALEPIVAVGVEATLDEFYEVVVTLEALDREVEARAWEAYARRDEDGFEFVRIDGVTGSLRHVDSPYANEWAGLSSYPLPDMRIEPPAGGEATPSDYAVAFEDQAIAIGLDFTYVPAPDDTTPGKRIIELTGGGVAAIDFDLDAWPDMFFTQGG